MSDTPTDSYLSWGRCFRYAHRVRPLRWRTDDLSFLRGAEGSVLPYGCGRSYGDSCLNEGGTLLTTTGLNRFIAFDRETGVLRCEAGVTLEEVLALTVPAGWFLSVTPGTKFVTVGGAVANDVHGKNHHVAGTFGCHVRAFELARSDGSRYVCTPAQHAEWYRATIGGMGLTGLILWVELQLKHISSPAIDLETIKFTTLDEFFALSEESDQAFEYTVSWLDCLSRGSGAGRGIFGRGNHAAPDPARNGHARSTAGHGLLRVPFDVPEFLLNHWTMQAFNWAVYHAQRPRVVRRRLAYEPFFYPLDAIHDWNRGYGRRGFFQYQFVMPTVHRPAFERVLDAIAESGDASFLVVLKKFGDVPSPGLLSFPAPGINLALDFPNRGPQTLALLERLDAIVIEHGGRLYPAKDARMSPHAFQASFPQWQAFAEYVDPKFSSSFWRRVTQP